MTTAFLHAEFGSPETAAAAVESLVSAGVSPGDIEIYSRRPVETESPLLPRRSRMSLVAVLSAIAAGSGATALVFWIQRDYPLVTGGMPVTSGWATAVVTFEVTMAGAIFGTLCMMIREAGLAGSRRRAPVPDLPDEGVIVQLPRAEGLAERLAGAGALRVEIAEPPG